MAADTETLTAPALTAADWRWIYEQVACLGELAEAGHGIGGSITGALRDAIQRGRTQAEAERDAALRAQQIAERDAAAMKEHAQGWRKEADQHLTEQAEQVAKRRAAEAERDAALKRAEAAEARVKEWEVWHSDLTYDFCGVTDNSAADRLHDWSWIEDHRPPPPTLSQPGAAS